MGTRTSDWTGADGGAWTLSSGSWTHTTDNATIGGPTQVINTNRGRARVTSATTQYARRAHHLDYTNFKSASAEIQVEVDSRSASNQPRVVLGLKTAGTGGNAARYQASFGSWLNGKTPEAYMAFEKVNGSGLGITTLATRTLTPTAADDNADLMVAFRAVVRDNHVLLQAKCWTAGDSVPAWSDELIDGGVNSWYTTDTTSGLWNASGGFALAEDYSTEEPAATLDVIYDDLLATQMDAIYVSYANLAAAHHAPACATIQVSYANLAAAHHAPGTTLTAHPSYADLTATHYAPVATPHIHPSFESLAAAHYTPGASPIIEPGYADLTATHYAPSVALLSSSKGTVTVSDALAGTVTVSDARVGTVTPTDAGVGTLTVTDT